MPGLAPGLFSKHLADYDSELRRTDGRVDIDAMVTRLKELGVTTYYWLIWHAPTDWEDLKLFLPKASEAGIDVWVYLVPLSESPPQFGTRYSEPFRLDYLRWAEEISRLSHQHTNLTAWVIDDFYANRAFFTPAYLREMQTRAKRINPRLAFLPLMYFNEIQPKFTEDYHQVIDGVVVAYLQDRDQIEQTWAVLNDATIVPPSELSYPPSTPSKSGDFVAVSQSAKVLPADQYVLAFRERDDFTGPTSGYHFKQLLMDGMVVWEEDVAGGSPAWRKIAVDVTEHVHGKTSVIVAFRLLDKKGVSNFGVHWSLSQLQAEGLQLDVAITEPAKWQVDRHGAFDTGFGEVPKVGQHRFHIPFVSMMAGDQEEFRQRHGDPATPERVAEYLRMSLQAWRDGKCDGVVTYCLDKRPQSRTFTLARDLFHQYARVREVPSKEVPLWGHFETSVVNSRSYANPFTDVSLVATFIRPDKGRVSFWGFYDGDGHGGQMGNVWRLRFMPDQVGIWSYECSFSDGASGASGVFRCVADGANPGPLRIDPVNPHCWVFADGSHFFPRAYTAPELFVAASQTCRTYWIARVAPYWNVTWNIAGEWDELLTQPEFDDLGTFLKEMDPWKHPLTSHALGTTVDRPWVDFRVQQFAAGTSSDSITNASRAMADYTNKPVFAFETSWQATPGKLTADQVRTGAWGSLMGGAFYLYAECFEPTLTWGDGSAFEFIEIMNDFLGGLAYWKLKPDETLVNEGSLCLADPGCEYVVYRQSGGTIIVNLPDIGHVFRAEWLDPRTGDRKVAAAVDGGAKQTFPCPDAMDWVLHLRR